jgi:hypothetical protein
LDRIDEPARNTRSHLERSRFELSVLLARVGRREAELLALHEDLERFESRLERMLGPLFRQLDAIRGGAATRIRSSGVAASPAGESAGQEPRTITPPQRSSDLRQLYREVVKRVHPDRAFDEPSRARCTELMAEANRAYARGDRARLEAMLAACGAEVRAACGAPELELRRIESAIATARARLLELESEIVAAEASELNRLRLESLHAGRAGRDLLAEMAAMLRVRIDRAAVESGAGEVAV